MSFVHHEYLYLLIGVIPLFYVLLKAKTLDINEIFSKEVLDKIVVKQRGFISKRARLFILLVALIFMVLALARPVVLQEEKEEKEVEGFNLVIALDISKSMNAKDIFPTRLEYAKHLIFKVMDELKEAKISVIAFSSDAFLVSPFSEDFKSIEFLVSNLNPEFISAKGSSILSALSATKKVYDAINAQEGNVLLISDGADGKEIQESVEFAKANNLKVHVLNLGTKQGDSLEDENGVLIKDSEGHIVISKRDDAIAKVASSSDGSFLSVTSNTNTLELFVMQIRDASAKQKVQRDIYQGAQELFLYPLVFASILVFLSFNSLRFFLLFLVLFISKDVNAGLLDFLHVKKANDSYKSAKYEEASHEFSLLDSSEARYNEANALYKNKEYEKALERYKSIKNFKEENEYQRLHNLGNTYAALKQYDEAIKNYEEALKLKDDADTRHNLELLKNQKNQENKNQDNENQDKQEQREDKQQENQKNSDAKKESQSQEKQNESQNDQKEQEKTEQQNSTNEQKDKKMMSEIEAKKWEEKMKEKNFKTQPMKMQIQKRSSVENSW